MTRPPTASPLKPRKTPRQPRAEKTVAALLEAAALVLERDGLEGFNTNAVARRAGVSIGSLYQYLPGKDALTLALIHREGERFHAEAASAVGAPTGTLALKAFVGACVRSSCSGRLWRGCSTSRRAARRSAPRPAARRR